MASRRTPWVKPGGAARAYLNSAQTATKNIWNKIAYDAEQYDKKDEFDLTAGNHKFSAAEDGTYLILAQVQMANLVDTDFLTSAIYVGGTIEALSKIWVSGSGTGYITAMTVARLNKGNYVEGYCYHNHSTDLPIKVGSGYTFITVYQLGQK